MAPSTAKKRGTTHPDTASCRRRNAKGLFQMVFAEPQQSLLLVRPGQRPCFEQATGPDEYGLWLDERVPVSRTAPPIRSRTRAKYPGVKIGARGTNFPTAPSFPVGSFYGKATGILGLRLFPQSRFRRGGAEEVADAVEKNHEAVSTTPTRQFLQRQEPGAALSRRHVLRLLPCRAEPDQSAGRSREPELGEPELNRGAQYFWVDRIFVWKPRRPTNFIFQLFHTSRPGRDGYLARLHRQHQQPAHDERGLQPRRAAGDRQALGKEKIAGGELNNKQFNDSSADAGRSTQFFERGHGVDAARAEGRRRLGRRAGRAQPRLSSTSACSARNGCCTSTPLVGGKHDHADRDRRSREKNSAYWQATEAADAQHGAVLPQGGAARPAGGRAGRRKPT